jgi:PAS domain S-box-containing protein
MSPTARSVLSPHGEDFEEQLRRCETNLKRLLDATTDGVMIHRDLRYVYANPAALKLLGRSHDEVVGHSPFELVPPRFRLFLAERIMEAYTRKEPMPEVEERLLHASGAEVPVEVIAVPVIFDGEVATLVHIRDITSRRALEVRLRAADRLASAGLVAAGVAHEINNPLAYALSSLELLAERLDASGPTKRPGESSPAPLEKDVNDRQQKAGNDAHDGNDATIPELVASARDGVERAVRVARDVKMFTEGRRATPARVAIHRVLDSCIAFLGADVRSRVNLIKHYGDVPDVLGNEARLAQVFLNLLLNAVQALAHRMRGPCDVTLTTYAKGDRVVVEVKDTGAGIPAELQSTIFEPLFTTKPHGMGLGLALSTELVAEEEGELSVTSTPGSGTTFTVSLRMAPREELASERRPRVRSSGKRILIVDDEPRLAATMRMMLCAHHTTMAQSGHEALQRLRSGEAYDLILCDLAMPNVDGMDLYQRIRTEWPGLEERVIFLTGDAFVSRTQEFLSSVPNAHLQKPFDPNELLDRVDAVLARAG